ncbi:MAG: hypothetical protein HY513_05035 [Candidatus Aenigmarchaeota archaeon]|nr:hypothetical protein [Candidatus Aenigmarchaeota archaeon]
MMFETTNGKIDKLDKKIKRMESTVKMLQDSFGTITEVVKKMQNQNESLKKNYETLGKTKEKMMEISKRETGMRSMSKLLESPLNPIRDKIKENVDLIREVAAESIIEAVEDDHDSEQNSAIVNGVPGFKSPKTMKEEDIIYMLKNGSVSSDELAHKLRVHKAQVEVWASKLQKKNLVDVKNSGNKVLIVLKRSK